LTTMPKFQCTTRIHTSLIPLLIALILNTVTFLIPSATCFSTAPPRLIHHTTNKNLCSTHRLAPNNDLISVASTLNSALDAVKKELTRTCLVQVGLSSSTYRLGLIATTDIKKGDLILNMPHDERWELTAAISRNIVYKGILDKDYDGWTGDAGMVALQLLNEVARMTGSGINQPIRPGPIQEFMEAWVRALPSPKELDHPLLWSESEQEVLQSSSNTKIYRILDDLEEDATWLIENVFEKDRAKFPATIPWNNGQDEIQCFSLEGYKWAMALAQSRSVFVDGNLRLVPFMDMCNHNDGAKEIQGGTMGAFGTTKGCELKTSKAYQAGEEVFCSYGPKSPADYLLEQGFCPPLCWKMAISEITLELDPEDRFYDDKLDILEFETYDQAPMDPVQSFDVVSAPGRDGEPDPAMIQFARLRQLGGLDAFLLESLFRKEVWGFMALPVSESNELAVVEAISEVCESALEDLNQCPEGGREICSKLRQSESKALKRTLEFMLREKEALDLKEYYQERRLKDLGLDSEWSPEDDMIDPDLSYGQTRVPGGADYDW
jgi:[ribulose-bisphosphate carboxylase]/[fructose-bisphosphate aldolase]-lysine N-methyltransferase